MSKLNVPKFSFLLFIDKLTQETHHFQSLFWELQFISQDQATVFASENQKEKNIVPIKIHQNYQPYYQSTIAETGRIYYKSKMIAMKNHKDDSFESLTNMQTFTNGFIGQLRRNNLNPRNIKEDLMSVNRIEIHTKESELPNDNIAGINAIYEYDNNVYYIELIVATYKIIWQFQNECKRLSNSNHLNASKQRCQGQPALEYIDCAFSQTACILDFARCNVIFETPNN